MSRLQSEAKTVLLQNAARAEGYKILRIYSDDGCIMLWPRQRAAKTTLKVALAKYNFTLTTLYITRRFEYAVIYLPAGIRLVEGKYVLS